MQVLSVTFYSISAIYCLFYIFLLFKTKNPFKNLLFNAIIGIGALAVIYLIKSFTGFYVPINKCTVICSAVGGLPAVFGILIFRIIL